MPWQCANGVSKPVYFLFSFILVACLLPCALVILLRVYPLFFSPVFKRSQDVRSYMVGYTSKVNRLAKSVSPQAREGAPSGGVAIVESFTTPEPNLPVGSG